MTAIQTTYSPVDGSIYVERPLATPAEIEESLSLAVIAQHAWRQISLDERADFCHRLIDAMVSNADDLGRELSWQMGRPIRYTPYEISGGFQERGNYMIDLAGEALKDIVPPQKDGFTRFIRREPVGVVLILAPWNYPYLTTVNAVIPALMAGDTVIIKHSDQTPLVAESFTAAAQAAGLPDGVIQHLHISHDTVAEVIQDPRISFISFTGSVGGGHAVVKAASTRFVRVATELGGKDPAYILPDADLAYAIANVVDGAMFNSGQSCCSIERVYVHTDIYDQFVEGAVALASQYILGNPLDAATTLGPLVRPRAADFVRGQIAQAVAQGARGLIDPSKFSADRPGTAYVAPQILTEVDHRMSVMVDETFGPVMGVMRVRDDAEALRLMNDSKYGLTASLWTADADHAARLGEHIETGTVFMNRCDYLDPALAWVGVKDTGLGCSLSVLGYDNFTRAKSYHLRTVIPK